MRTVSKHRTGLIATLMLAGGIGLWLLFQPGPGAQHQCEKQSLINNVSLVKLI